MFKLVTFSIKNPKLILWLSLLFTVFTAAFIPNIKIDVDPENMLSVDNASRVYHNEMKKKMDINDMIIVTISNDKNPNGVFNLESMKRIHSFSSYLRKLEVVDEKEGVQGVVAKNLFTLPQLDTVESGKDGSIIFSQLLKNPPKTEDEALKIRTLAQADPFLSRLLLSHDNKAINLYIPLSSKDMSYHVAEQIQKKIKELGGEETYSLTGLPLAEDTFGIEMFSQMAMSIPLVGMLILALIYFFFRSMALSINGLVLSLLTVIITMGLFIASGLTVHIMSSMIPVFLMPIAVLDAVHILSHYYDEYQIIGDKKLAIEKTMKALFKPMLYTSLTSAVGFLSLALAPIPPIQGFGIFIALGIMIAWLLSMTFLPAVIILLKPVERHIEDKEQSPFLKKLAIFSAKYQKAIVIVSIFIVILSFKGIEAIEVNDNPINWLVKEHPVRAADDMVNEKFNGSYLLYLSFNEAVGEEVLRNTDIAFREVLDADLDELPLSLDNAMKDALHQAKSPSEYVHIVREFIGKEVFSTPDDSIDIDEDMDSIFQDMDAAGNEDAIWLQAQKTMEDFRHVYEVMKRPEVIQYFDEIQQYLASQGVVKASYSLSDLLKKVNQELHGGDKEFYVIPESKAEVAEVIIAYQSGHFPWRVENLANINYSTGNIILQLNDGSNKNVSAVVDSVNTYVNSHPAPFSIRHNWFGLSFVNTVWQENMVKGMNEAMLSSILFVLLMMIFLFRSFVWGVLAVIPLSVTVAAIYGLIGLLGKDYDMPVAVISVLTLGLSVDFAIHFISQTKDKIEAGSSVSEALDYVFNIPAHAIIRNMVIIALGFTPLLFASLVPYQTVAILMGTIMIASGSVTLILLPALIRLLSKRIQTPQALKPLYNKEK